MENRRSSKKILSLILAVIMLTGILAASFTVSYGESIPVLAVGDKAAAATNVNLRSAASNTAKVQLVLNKGTVVTVVSKSGSWYKVKLDNGKTGFVYGKYLVLKTKAASAPAATTGKNTTVKLEPTLTLATTTSTQDTGLLDVLVPAFEKKYGVKVKVVAVGTGEAIEMGKQGNADVLLVHARSSEDAFVQSGYGVNRKDVMYNYFFLAGPKNDPAGVAGTKDVVKALAKISQSKAKFISRGDQSGTHKKELTLWTKANLKPQGNSWYMESGQGMGDTLMMASEMGAYTLVDSGTWWAFENKVNMKIAVEGDSLLFNPYGVIAVNPAKYPNIHYNSAMAFINFITSDEGQRIIGSYKKSGHTLFVPNATK